MLFYVLKFKTVLSSGAYFILTCIRFSTALRISDSVELSDSAKAKNIGIV